LETQEKLHRKVKSQISLCTRGCIVDMCTGQHNMQEDTSSLLTELLDGEIILMDVCKIQGLNRHFAKFRDEFSWLMKIQGRIWGITPFLCDLNLKMVMKAGFNAYPKAHSVRGKKKVKGKNPKKKQKENLAESEWEEKEKEKEGLFLFGVLGQVLLPMPKFFTLSAKQKICTTTCSNHHYYETTTIINNTFIFLSSSLSQDSLHYDGFDWSQHYWGRWNTFFWFIFKYKHR